VTHAFALAALGSALIAAPALAAEPLAGPLAPLAFMIGNWRSVDSTGAGAGGDSSIHSDLGGRILVRRDHVRIRSGGAFDIFMVVFPDGQRLRADFIDTEGHAIQYSVTPAPGPSATFEAPGSASAPGFRLSYGAVGADRLHIRFEIAPPGGAYKTYTEGDVARR
jgi:hypothetical protein